MSSVDVLITVYNGEKFIAQAIESIQAQTIEDWRLIVVDDSSTDATPDILKSFANNDPRILVRKGAHKGIAAAATLGLTDVSAPLIARIDADDVAVPNRLETQRNYLLAHPQVVAVGSYVRLIDAQNRRLGLRKAPTDPIKIGITLKTRNCMCHPSSMIRTEALRRIGGYRVKFHNSLDYDLWLRLSEIGEISNQALELLLYRRHPSQVSASGNAHRQTLYSVGAAIDYFFRRYGKADRESVIDEFNNDNLATCLQEIYGFELSTLDRTAVNRHAIRLLRYSKALSQGARAGLVKAMLPNLSLMETLKHKLYNALSAQVT
jgi:glycosyltransferase involved in cell wall biosynthesis